MEPNDLLKMKVLSERNHKLRQLCRQLNRKRRQLRDKVDLLCRDLVYSNGELTQTLLQLRRVYDFQNDLSGEFDLRYLLHKALRSLREQLPDSSAAIYLCSSGAFEAHVAGAWYDQVQDIADIEQALEKSVVKKVLETKQAVLIDDAGESKEILPADRKTLSGLSLLVPGIWLEGKIIGVVAVYRQAGNAFTQKDINSIQPLLSPLARAINAAQKVQQFVIQN